VIKPLLLVDVDGCLNAFGYGFKRDIDPDDPSTWDGDFEDVFEAEGYIIRVPKGTKERMTRLLELYDGVWATTWRFKAGPQLSPHLGFGADWPVIDVKDSNAFQSVQTWKLPSVGAWCNKNTDGGKIAWMDDDLHFDAEEWADRNGFFLAHCNPEVGLSEETTVAHEEYARG